MYYLVLQVWTTHGIALTTIPHAYPSWEKADQAGKDAIRMRAGDKSGTMGYTVVPIS